MERDGSRARWGQEGRARWEQGSDGAGGVRWKWGSDEVSGVMPDGSGGQMRTESGLRQECEPDGVGVGQMGAGARWRWEWKSLSGTTSYYLVPHPPYLVPHLPIWYHIPYLVPHLLFWYSISYLPPYLVPHSYLVQHPNYLVPHPRWGYHYINESSKWKCSLLVIWFCNTMNYTSGDLRSLGTLLLTP